MNFTEEEEEGKKEKEKEASKDKLKESTEKKSSPEPRFSVEKYEPVVKTPPEPTRVKSPDQVSIGFTLKLFPFL